MANEDSTDPRLTFDRAAAIYHEARPLYPEALFDRLMELLRPAPSVIEVGPGTGQATEPLLQRGATVRAIDIGVRLANALEQRLAPFVGEQLEIVVGDFEQQQPVAASVDAVVSATAYHWISPAEQLARPRRWLRPDGRLAIIDTMQVDSAVDDGYFDAAQSIYAEHGQSKGSILATPDNVIPFMHRRMTENAACVDVTLDRYRWDQTYTADGYRALLNTYSGTIAMSEPERTAMVDALSELVDELGGKVTRPLVITLATCRFGHD